jgi:hypothetical protein
LVWGWGRAQIRNDGWVGGGMQRDERALSRERRWANRDPVRGSAAAQARRCGANAPGLPGADHDWRGRRIGRRSRRGRARPGVRAQGRTCSSWPEQITIGLGGESEENLGGGRARARRQGTRENLLVLARADHDRRVRRIGRKSRRGRRGPGSGHEGPEVSGAETANKNARARFQAPNPKTGTITREVSGTEPQNKNAPNRKQETHARGFSHRTPKQERARGSNTETQNKNLPNRSRLCPEQITICACGESEEDRGVAGRGLASGHKGEPARLGQSRSRSARAANPKKIAARPGAARRQAQGRTCPSWPEQITIGARGESEENPGEACRQVAKDAQGFSGTEPQNKNLPKRSRLARSRSRSARAANRKSTPARPGAACCQGTKDARGFRHRTQNRNNHARGFRHRTQNRNDPREVSSTEIQKTRTTTREVSGTEPQNKNHC